MQRNIIISVLNKFFAYHSKPFRAFIRGTSLWVAGGGCNLLIHKMKWYAHKGNGSSPVSVRVGICQVVLLALFPQRLNINNNRN